MKFLSFLIIFTIVILTISIKLIIANQEGVFKQIKSQIIAIDEKIEKKQADISYSTRPQQLKKLNTFIKSRQHAAERLEKGLEGLKGLRMPKVFKGCTHVYYVFGLIICDKDMIKKGN